MIYPTAHWHSLQNLLSYSIVEVRCSNLYVIRLLDHSHISSTLCYSKPWTCSYTHLRSITFFILNWKQSCVCLSWRQISLFFKNHIITIKRNMWNGLGGPKCLCHISNLLKPSTKVATTVSVARKSRSPSIIFPALIVVNDYPQLHNSANCR